MSENNSHTDLHEQMRVDSGSIQDQRTMVCLLYLLARDHLPVGEVEQLIDEIAGAPEGVWTYSNGWLALWAQYSADRLEAVEVRVPGEEFELRSMPREFGVEDA